MNPIVSGLLVGALFGFALQRGRFCMNSAFRDIIVGRDFVLFKAVAAALLVETIGFAIMAATGIINLAPPALMWGANLIGGLIFGMGMVLAGGCASGITYRTGEGMVGAMSAVAGFSLIAMTTGVGLLTPVSTFLKTSTKVMTADDKPLTLANVFGLNHTVVAIGLAVIIIIIWAAAALKNKAPAALGVKAESFLDAIFKRGWHWLPTGIFVGLVGILAFPMSAATGRNYPLGITAGWVNIWQWLFKWTNVVEGQPKVVTLNWGGALIIGIVLGALVAALIAREFSIRAPEPKVMLLTFLGGMMMGFGASVSGGCNIGHILSGVPQLSIGSIVGGLSIVAGGWAMAYFMFVRPMNA
jgi:uncharacterized protein